jgi:hypothetical protein
MNYPEAEPRGIKMEFSISDPLGRKLKINHSNKFTNCSFLFDYTQCVNDVTNLESCVTVSKILNPTFALHKNKNDQNEKTTIIIHVSGNDYDHPSPNTRQKMEFWITRRTHPV